MSSTRHNDVRDWRAIWRELSLLAPDPEAAERRSRNMRSMLRNSPVMLAITLVNTMLVVAVLRGQVAVEGLALWAALMGAACAAGLTGWWRSRKVGQSKRRAAPALIHRAMLHAALLGALWGAMPALWLPQMDQPTQLLVSVLVTGLMAGGALMLSLVPLAAYAYLVMLTAGALVALLRARFPHADTVAVLLLLYAFTLAVAVASIMRMFTQRVRVEREAQRQNEVVSLLLRDFEESTADVLWEVDAAGRLLQASHRLAGLLEWPHAKVSHMTLLSALGALQVEGSRGVERLRLAFDRGEAFRDQVVRVRTSQGTRWWSVTAKPLTDAEGLPRGWRGVISDVTAERKSHQHLTYLAHYDSLTGLANRVSVRNRLAQAIEQAGLPSSRRSALMCLDLDNFKGINDSLGHSVGDAVLQEVARRLRQQMRKSDLCGRLGGDEFAVVVDDVRNDDEVLQLGQRLIATMRVPVNALGHEIATGVSIGVSFLPDHATRVDEALISADLALYSAKSSGRGRVVTFTQELGASQRRRMDVERELREALARGQLEVVYQPQVEISTWRIVAAEALLRWRHPQLGMVSPTEFIGVAEDTGLIHNIGAWVIECACRDGQELLKGLRIAVNVSPSQIQRGQLANELEAQLRLHRMDPQRLELEITESLLMEDAEGALRSLHALRQLGVRIALDDFGTGYSSLAYLRRFPFDKLKIDRAFIGELMAASDARAIVRTMLELARVLGMETLAEGVEEPAQLAVLERVGCEAMQGFLVARPMPAADLAVFMASWTGLPRPHLDDELPLSVQGSLSGVGVI